MALSCDLNFHRRIGWAYGQLQDRLDLGGATLFETTHRPASQVPVHEHEFPYFALLINGQYREPTLAGEAQFIPFSAVYHPAQTRHAGLVDKTGCHFFAFELEPSWLSAMNAKSPAASIFDWHGGKILWLMLRLFREYRGEMRSRLTMESLALEILSAADTLPGDATYLPASCWGTLREKIHDNFREPLRIRDLATAAGVHPVHVARLFRRHAGLTPGEYLQRVRAQNACRLMQQPDRPLCNIALDSGFFDQSHMNRILRRLAGCSPSAVRSSSKWPSISKISERLLD